MVQYRQAACSRGRPQFNLLPGLKVKLNGSLHGLAPVGALHWDSLRLLQLGQCKFQLALCAFETQHEGLKLYYMQASMSSAQALSRQFGAVSIVW